LFSPPANDNLDDDRPIPGADVPRDVAISGAPLLGAPPQVHTG
jgi:hypothetical protein